MTIAELKTKADNLGLDRGIVRLYGDLRKIETWERAITSHQTVTVEAVEIVEIADTVADEIYSDLREAQKPDEIIPFTHEQDEFKIGSKICFATDWTEETHIQGEIISNHHEAKAYVVIDDSNKRYIVGPGQIKAVADCPPPPPPPVIIRSCPIPERQDIPGIEIAERESPRPGHGRGDERFRNLGDRLGEKIKADIFKYFDSICEWMFEQFAEFDRLTQYEYFDAWYQIEKFQSVHRPEKIKIYEFIEKAIALVGKIKKEHIPWYLQPDMPAPPVWCVTEKDDYFLLMERPGPIPTLSIDYGGEFIPNRYHELGVNVYCWKFPNQLRAEEFFEQITQATNYQFIPVSQPQLLLAGV